MQEEVGLQSATDGEFRRASWHMDFIYSLDGISRASDDLVVHFRNAEGGIDFTPAALKVDGKLGLEETIFGDDFAFVRDAHEERGQADDPVAEHGPLPRRARRRSTRPCTPTSTRSGPTWSPRIATRCGGWPSSAARTCSSTTPASRT